MLDLKNWLYYTRRNTMNRNFFLTNFQFMMILLTNLIKLD